MSWPTMLQPTDRAHPALSRPRSPGRGRRRYARRALLLATGLPVIVGLIWAWTRDPTAIDLGNALADPSLAAPLGTDHLGRDVLARIVHGLAVTPGLTAAAVLINLVVGTTLGFIAARTAGAVRSVILRVVEVLVALPTIIVGLVLAAVLRPGVGTLLLAVLSTGWTPFARLTFGLTERLGREPWLDAVVLSGAREPRIVVRHLLPNLVRPLGAHGLLRFANTLLNLAGLSYLGLGIQPPTPDWGVMLAQGQPYLERQPLLVLAPIVAIVGVTVTVSLVGRSLEQRWDRHGGYGHLSR